MNGCRAHGRSACSSSQHSLARPIHSARAPMARPPRLLAARAESHRRTCVRRCGPRVRTCARGRGEGVAHERTSEWKSTLPICSVPYIAFNSPPDGEATALVAAVGAGTRFGACVWHAARAACGFETRRRGVDVPWTAETNWKEALSDCPVSVVHICTSFLKGGSNSRM